MAMSLILWVVYSCLIALFLILGISILRRNSGKRLNQSFFIFLFLIACSLVVNIIYRVLENPSFNILGNTIVIFLTMFSLIFLLLFNIIIWKSDKILKDKYKIIMISIWGILCAVLFLIPEGVTWTADDNPKWSDLFFLYGVLISQILYVCALFVNLQIYKGFEDKKLKIKYLWTILAVILFDWFILGNFIANWLDDSGFRSIFSITALVAIPAGILLYRGVKKEA
ncbi:MAG: hypothetical protein GY870_15590 [archaeon]|nr:hypothetical protein [archaeon]